MFSLSPSPRSPINPLQSLFFWPPKRLMGKFSSSLSNCCVMACFDSKGARFMVIASVWGFQGACSSHPQCTTAESLRINRQPTSVFPTTRKKAHNSQRTTRSLSASLWAPEGSGPLIVDLGGLVMSPAKAAGEDIDAQRQDPQNMSGSVSCDGSIQGVLPQWAIGRTGGGPLARPPKLLTLVIIQKHGKVLLGMKKRG